MATHDYVIDNASGSAVRTDLNNVFQAILTNNSSGSAPSTTAAYMLWADTSNNILKMRNSADNAWINLFTLSGGVDVDAASNFAAAVTFTDDVTFDGATAGRDVVFDRSDNALEFADNAKAIFGTGADLEIYHNGSNSIIDSNTGNLEITADSFFVNNAANNEVQIKAVADGAVELYFDNSKKAETVTGGFTVTGTCTATAFAGDGSALTGVGGGVTSDSQSNTVAGTGAGGSFSGTNAEENTLFGKDAGSEITTADNNCAFGREALGENQTGHNNTAIGHNALSKSTGADNTALGQGAAGSATSATNTVAIGHGALAALTTGASNLAIGVDALSTLTTTSENLAIGRDAGKLITTAYSVTAIGNGCLDNCTTGYFNTGVGKDVLPNCTSGVQNVGIGANCLLGVTTGNNNVAVGTQAGQSITTGHANTCIGNAAGVNRTTASNLTAVGTSACYSNTTGDQCTAIGDNAMYQNQTGHSNVAVGTNALYAATGGDGNTAVGRYSNMLLTTGDNTTSIGYNAGYHTTTGTYNINVGGQPSSATANYEITLGDTGHATLRCNDTSIGSLSDQRDKIDIVDLPIGLDFLNTLKPRQFKWKTRDGNIKDNSIRAGFIAQELQESEKDYRYLKLVMDNNPDRLEANEGHLIPLLVKAIQELSVKVTALEAG